MLVEKDTVSVDEIGQGGFVVKVIVSRQIARVLFAACLLGPHCSVADETSVEPGPVTASALDRIEVVEKYLRDLERVLRAIHPDRLEFSDQSPAMETAVGIDSAEYVGAAMSSLELAYSSIADFRSIPNVFSAAMIVAAVSLTEARIDVYTRFASSYVREESSFSRFWNSVEEIDELRESHRSEESYGGLWGYVSEAAHRLAEDGWNP